MLDYLRSLGELFFPRYCPVCGETLADGEHFVCTSCRWNMPLTYFWQERENRVWSRLSGLFELQQASSFLFYQRGSGYDKLIHNFKYNGKFRLSRELGVWFGDELTGSGLYDDIDLIIPVPLHALRLMKRGYNQSEYFARGLGKSMGLPVERGNVVRTRHNRSQTRHSHRERWDNVAGIFGVKHPDRLTGKHILLVDDVLTTGATIESCAAAILESVPDCRISVATVATTHRDQFD